MKFMSSFQCLMGGNVVQFQDSSSSSSRHHVDDDDHKLKKKKRNKTTTSKKRKLQLDRKVIKVIKPDGEINLYQKPMMVSELMTIKEHMVCRSDSFYIGQKIPPLSQHDRLLPGHTYFLLPAHHFHSVLSFVTIASFTSPNSNKQVTNDVDEKNMKAVFLKKAASSSCSPFDIQKTPSGSLRIRVSELFISQLIMDQAASSNNQESSLLLCTTPQLDREYKQLVVGSRIRSWKPKLEMIKETPHFKSNRKQVKMLFFASINRMKTKMKKKQPSQTAASSSSATLKRKKKKKKLKTKKPSS